MAIRREIVVYECEKCGKQYSNEYVADICCKQYYCEDCGKPTEKYCLVCPECHEKRVYNKAKKMSYIDYIKKYPKNMIWYNDEYYSELEDLIDYLESQGLPIPDYVFGTSEYRVEVDIVNAIDQAEQDCGLEDFYFDNTEELIDFTDKWNKENGTNAFMVTEDIIIVLTEQEKRGNSNE